MSINFGTYSMLYSLINQLHTSFVFQSLYHDLNSMLLDYTVIASTFLILLHQVHDEVCNYKDNNCNDKHVFPATNNANFNASLRYGKNRRILIVTHIGLQFCYQSDIHPPKQCVNPEW